MDFRQYSQHLYRYLRSRIDRTRNFLVGDHPLQPVGAGANNDRQKRMAHHSIWPIQWLMEPYDGDQDKAVLLEVNVNLN